MTEVFLDIPGLKNYSVSSFGQVRREISKGSKKQRILKQYVDKKGYKYVCPSIDGIVKTIRVHRLVCLSFIGCIDNLTVNHIDLDKQNNNISNLELISSKENTKHANVNGHFSLSGAKITYEDAVAIRHLKINGNSSKSISLKYNLTKRTIDRIIKGVIWSRPQTLT